MPRKKGSKNKKVINKPKQEVFNDLKKGEQSFKIAQNDYLDNLNRTLKSDINPETGDIEQNPQELFTQLLEQNNLVIDFDVLEGAIPTKFGIIKLEKPTLVVKASYGSRK